MLDVGCDLTVLNRMRKRSTLVVKRRLTDQPANETV